MALKKNMIIAKARPYLSTVNGQGIFGSGKGELLAIVEKCGSLRKAAAELGRSYRQAWGDINKAEKHLGFSLVLRSRGGRQGGKMVLTERGARFLRAWEQHRETERAAERRGRPGEQEADDWDAFWSAYSQALGYELSAGQPSIDGWEGGIEEGQPLSWHLDQLRACGFYATDCFARWDCDALYGGIKEG